MRGAVSESDEVAAGRGRFGGFGGFAAGGVGAGWAIGAGARYTSMFTC